MEPPGAIIIRTGALVCAIGLLCAAKTLVADLVRRIRDLRPVDAGDIRNARVFEAMTALLLNLNRKHKTRASVKILGV